jgi:class 3 adenylate cyclase
MQVRRRSSRSSRASRGVQGERRFITALFCDVTGSTTFAEQLDHEEWTEIMNEAFD